ncbi:MAG: glycosyltransferase family 2 protein [Paenibacillus sp.]|nr:glycosyltransferase family 2 protein [Paenibacillus sp.]
MTSPITIVLPVYNRASTIGRTLRSIDAQSVKPAHIIIVDNASTDSSLSIINSWAATRPDVTVLSEPRRGASTARNRGLREVTTEWTMFFDSDDEMLPSHIGDFSRAIKKYPEADILGRDIFTRFLDGSTRRLYFHAGGDNMFHHIFRATLSTQRYIARTSLFRSVGGWNESLIGWNDYELGVRLLLTTPVMVDIGGNPSAITHQQKDSISGVRASDNHQLWETAIETVRSIFRTMPATNDRSKSRYLYWLDARAMLLAATYEHEARKAPSPESTLKARKLANDLYSRTLAALPSASRLILKAIYRHNLTFRRLSWMLARIPVSKNYPPPII